MEYFFAPLEGITGPDYRRVHHRIFPGVDRYYTPFLSPNQNHVFSRRELRQVDPALNEGIPLVPQLLTRSSGDFLWAAGELAAMGYREVNLNLGCPSGTVTAKGKGAGLLARPEELDRFLEEIFSRSPLSISIKTRVGFSSPEEFPRLLEIFSQYPIACLTVHPRVREDHYRRPLRPEAFDLAWDVYPGPLCFNGDLTTVSLCQGVKARYPCLSALMLGRGLLGDPALVRRLRGGPPARREELRSLHDQLYEGYCASFQSRRNAVYHMKELWRYLACLFEDRDRFLRQLRKAADPAEYESLVGRLFAASPLLPDLAADW